MDKGEIMICFHKHFRRDFIRDYTFLDYQDNIVEEVLERESFIVTPTIDIVNQKDMMRLRKSTVRKRRKDLLN